MTAKRNKEHDPGKITTYFLNEKKVLAIITVTGILYNVGMAAGPWFEGQLAQYLFDILNGTRIARDMLVLAIAYVVVIFFVQFSRFLKRFYVRRFANNVNRSIKDRIYHTMVHMSVQQAASEKAGSMMTKAISDAEACTEGMRKATTEVFDTGVVMVVYLVMLLSYDWRLTLICLLFPPIAYVIAAELRKIVSKAASESKKSTSRLNAATLDMVGNALTYRVYGMEKVRRDSYEDALTDYEHKSTVSNVLDSSMEPIYLVISMIGLMPILWFGGKNVLGSGWINWNIAAFSTYVACFTKLAVKSSHAAKLFNAVQKAQVSWKRIKPYLVIQKNEKRVQIEKKINVEAVEAEHLTFVYPDQSEPVIKNASFQGKKGQIIGITGQIASGKSTLGQIFLNEYPYTGNLYFIDENGNKTDLKDMYDHETDYVSWLGHQPQLFAMTIEENICLDHNPDHMQRLKQVLEETCFDQEVQSFEHGIKTIVGNKGMRLSGGQAQRLALARALYHKAPVYILDDPFSAVDNETEMKILSNLRKYESDSVIFLISHRLNIFPQLDSVIWMENGAAMQSTHKKLLLENEEYAKLYKEQSGGRDEQ